MKLNVNSKLLLYVLGPSLLIYILAMGYTGIELINTTADNAKYLLRSEAENVGNQVETMLDKYMDASLLAAEAIEQAQLLPEEKRRSYYGQMLSMQLEQNTDILSIWSILETNALDTLSASYVNTPGSSILGNFKQVYYREQGKVVLNNYIEQDADLVFSNRIYQKVKSSGKQLLTEPYYYAYNNNPKDEVLQVNLVSPVLPNNVFSGIVGVDLPLNELQDYFNRLRPMEKGRVFLISQEGKFIVHPDSSFVTKSILEYIPDMVEEHEILSSLEEARFFEFEGKDPFLGTGSRYVFQPVTVGNSNSSWSIAVCVPRRVVYEESVGMISFTSIISLVGMLILLVVIVYIARSISDPIKEITRSLMRLSKGNIKNPIDRKFTVNDEVSQLAEATNELYSGLNQAADFAGSIGEGKLDAKYEMRGINDDLGTSLLKMQDSLIEANKQEQIKREQDEKRNWITRGLGQFGEIIRQDNDNMDRFSMNVLTNLSEFLDVAQVAIYINQHSEDDEFSEEIFELQAALAYNKRVKISRSVEMGKELIGRAAQENQLLYIEDMPEEFAAFTPGMKGQASPNHLIVSPMTINNRTYGVFELLSYNKFEPHHIEFIEKLSENVASIISSVKTNVRTAQLLSQSQEQADELSQQEEEMRQNLEEMQATQEEAAHREENLGTYIKSLNGAFMMMVLDGNGYINELSQSLAALYGSNLENMRGKLYQQFVATEESAKNEFSEFWKELFEEGRNSRMHKLMQRTQTKWLLENYIVLRGDGRAPRVLVVVIDKTNEVELNEAFKRELNRED